MGAIQENPRWAYNPENEESSPYFPQTICNGLFQRKNFKRFSLNLLFLIFFSRVGTEEQLLAAEELQNRKWSYHTAYNTWFQREGEAVEQTEDHEKGTYIFFDNTTFQTVKKSNFTFEYKYLVE